LITQNIFDQNDCLFLFSALGLAHSDGARTIEIKLK